MRKVFGIAVVSVLCAAGTAHAQGPAASGFSFGLRLGYGLPMAKYASSLTVSGVTLDFGDISDSVGGKIPIWLDAGYRLTSNVYVGGYFEYAPGLTKNCPPGYSCSASDVRLGANAQYRLLPGQSFDPWVGIGIGYEWLNLGMSGLNAGFHGWEFVNLQVGGDFLVGTNLGIGPYLAFSLAQFGTFTASQGGISASIDITDKSLHEWLQFGVKGTFDL